MSHDHNSGEFMKGGRGRFVLVSKLMIYVKSILVGAVTSVLSVALFALLPAIAMGVINSSEDGAWLIEHVTIMIVASLGFLVGFTSMFRGASRKFPTQI